VQAQQEKPRQIESLRVVAAIAVVVLFVVTFADSVRGAAAVDVAAKLGNQELAQMGLLDVTAAPFHADPSGKTDSTEVLQRAINYARDHQMVCFFPPGIYKISNTITCEQYRPLRRDGRRGGTRDYPCVLIGSRRADRRPCLFLAPHSPGYDDPNHPKYVVYFWAPGVGIEEPIDQPQPNISMNQMFIGIDIVIGEGNPGAVGIRHRGAQGSGVEDCVIDARHGFSGLEGGCGSGGSHANVTVIGGRIGVDLRQTQPAPTITGFTLIDQTETALLCSSRQALCAVGLRIETHKSEPVIVTRELWGAHHSQLCLVDSEIIFHQAGANTAIEAASSVYLNNVYVRGAETLVRQPGKQPLRGQPNGWVHIKEYASGRPQRYRARSYGNQSFEYPAPIFVGGKRLEVPFLADVESGPEPPSDLQSRHLWTKDFPSWEFPTAANVKDAPYCAAGDSVTDDADAIQRAIDENPIVFLPKGRYAVSKTIQLRPNTKLIGVHRCYSWLIPLNRPGGHFQDPTHPQPVIRTADDANARTVLAFLGIRTFQDSSAAYCLHWRSGRHSIFRDVNIVFAYRSRPQGPARLMDPGEASRLYNHPLVIIDGHGGGRWYNFHQESSHGHGPDYRHLLVRGTSEPLHFYQCNPEHARSDANLELRHARYVSFYGVKGEYYQPILWIRDCDHIRLFGYGGNAAAWQGQALFVVERTPNFLLANLVDSPRMPRGLPVTFFAGDGVDPRRWHMVLEKTIAGSTIKSLPLDRPVLYRRGWPVAGP